MGRKTIWDGKDLPEKGDLVLIHLASEKDWVAHTVKGVRILSPMNNGKEFQYLNRVFIDVDRSDDPRSSENSRLYADVRPMFHTSKAEKK